MQPRQIKPGARIQFARSTILAIFTYRDRGHRERHRARPDRLVLEVGAGPSLPLTSGRNPIVPSAPAARHVSGTATLYAPTQRPWIRSDWTSALWHGAHFVASARRKAFIFFFCPCPAPSPDDAATQAESWRPNLSISDRRRPWHTARITKRRLYGR